MTRVVAKIEAVKYWWREWYTRVTYTDGSTLHSPPWLSREAAEIVIRIWRRRYEQKVKEWWR